MTRGFLSKVTVALILVLSTLSCSRSSDAPTPRRYAFPRVERLDSARQTVQALNLPLVLSASAKVDVPREDWITAYYPSLGANLHLSVTRFSDEAALSAAIANRRQRMALNASGGLPRTDSFSTPQGWICERVTTSENVATPVQFIATGPEHTLVSGAFALGGSLAPADSLRPIVAELDGEAFSILTSLP